MEIIYKTIDKDESYLRQISKPVDFNDSTLADDIRKIEYACLLNKNIFALASIQIGIPKRIIYLKNTTLDIPLDSEHYNEKEILINPVLIDKQGITEFWEACASCLDKTGLVERPYQITVKYQDINNNEKIRTFTGFESTVMCHELDHLDGILHIDIAKILIDANRAERKLLREKEPYKILNRGEEI